MASAQPTTAKRAQVQAAVLAATEELLAASGSFQDLKIERIATSAGISRTSEALESISQLYFEHGPLLRAIVEVSTYDEEIAVFWRALLQRFADATTERILAEQKAGRAPAMPAAPTAFALVWMTERTFYQQLVQGAPVDTGELVAALNGIWLRSVYGT